MKSSFGSLFFCKKIEPPASGGERHPAAAPPRRRALYLRPFLKFSSLSRRNAIPSYLFSRNWFIVSTSASQSMPCTAHACSRLSPWAIMHPRQCIPASMSRSAMATSTCSISSMVISLFIVICVFSFVRHFPTLYHGQRKNKICFL